MSHPDVDPEDVLLILDHPFGKVETTLAKWMSAGPGPRPLVRPISARSRATGEKLALTVIPIAYRNDAESLALIEIGELEWPWSSPRPKNFDFLKLHRDSGG